MKKSSKKIEYNGQKCDVAFDENSFYIIVDNVFLDNIKTPVLDENGNQIFNEGENGSEIPVFSFEEKKFKRKAFLPFAFEDEKEAESYKLKFSEIKDLEEFTKPVEL